MSERYLALILALIFHCCCTNGAWAQARRALVIGNNAYQQVRRLEKAENDATKVGAALEKLDFKVTVSENLDRRKTNKAIANFESDIQTGDMVLFYFAGHGVAAGSDIVLLPTDTPADISVDEVAGEGFTVDSIIKRIQAHGARTTIVILDACRNSPFKTAGRDIEFQGLPRLDAPTGVFALYSAGIGQVALDKLSDTDTNENSVFARRLLPLLEVPGLSLVEIAKKVQESVSEEAKKVAHTQEPAYYDQVPGQIILKAGNAPADPDKACADGTCNPSVAKLEEPSPAKGPDPETEYWKAQALNTIEAYKSLLDMFPNHPRREAVLAAIRKLVDDQSNKDNQKKEEALWSDALAKEGPAHLDALRRYGALYPAGVHTDEAKRRIAALEVPAPAQNTESAAPIPPSVRSTDSTYCVSGLRTAGPNNFLVLRYQPVRDPNGGWDPNVKMFNGERVAVLATEGDFYRIRRTDGQEGYSARDKILPCTSVAMIAPPRPSEEATDTQQDDGSYCVTGLRSSGPNNFLVLRYQPIRDPNGGWDPDIKMFNGERLTVLGASGEFYHVRREDGSEGYSAREKIAKCGSSPRSRSVSAQQQQCRVGGLSSAGPDNWLALRDNPNKSSYFPPNVNLYNGTLLTVIGRVQDWYRVKTPSGDIGWAAARFVRC